MQPITLDFKPSLYLTLIIMLFSIGASAIVIGVVDAWLWKWSLISLVALYSGYVISLQAMLLLPWSYIGISINSKNEFRLHCKNGQSIQARVLPSTMVTPYLTVIHLQVDKKEKKLIGWQCKEMVIVPDLVAHAEQYRQLRVWLRWGAAKF
jgi:hypothetical protein